MNFPLSPTIGQTYTYGSKIWTWTGAGWKLTSNWLSFRVTEVTSAVNYLEAQGNVTGASPVLLSSGSDTNIDLTFASKGTGSVKFFTNGSTTSPTNQVLQLENLASSVNFIAMRGAVASGNVTIEAKGASADVGINIVTKGAGQFLVNGSPLTAASAVGGGPDHVFFENDVSITTSYTITTNKNAVTAGPITVQAGAAVTVPSGSVWTIV